MDKTLGNVILITNNSSLIDEFKLEFNTMKYNFSFEYLSYDKFFLLSNFLRRIDLIIFDNTDNGTLKLAKIPSIPCIILDSGDLIPKNLKVLSLFKLNDIPLLFKNIELSLEFLLSNKKIIFNGLQYEFKNRLLYKNGQLINLTNIESKLLHLLVSKISLVVTYEEIMQTIWYKKRFSIYSLRNMIKSIKTKTEVDFIKNISNRGYMIIDNLSPTIQY